MAINALYLHLIVINCNQMAITLQSTAITKHHESLMADQLPNTMAISGHFVDLVSILPLAEQINRAMS